MPTYLDLMHAIQNKEKKNPVVNANYPTILSPSSMFADIGFLVVDLLREPHSLTEKK